ncbi:MAG: response regulator [Gammaproteobacteria bacterium]
MTQSAAPATSLQPTTMQRLLIIDDDVALCDLLREYLGAEGFAVQAVHDGGSALAQVRAQAPDAIILDIMLPGRGGLDVLRDLRAETVLPVIMLTARGEDIDRIVGLELGADDYLPKPCNPRELVARVRAVLRRVNGPASGRGAAPVLRVEDLEMRTAERVVVCAGRGIELTSTEFNVLEVLLRHAGAVVGKDEVSSHALGRAHGPFDRAIDMHVSRLRRKLGPRADGSLRIKTVRGTGYIYTLPQPAP